MSFLQRIKVMLGMESEYDEEYDEYYDEEEEAADASASRLGRHYESPYADGRSTVRRLERAPDLDRARRASSREPAWERDDRAVRASEPSPAAAPQMQMHIAEPRSFTEAQGLADKFKKGQPVILNLTGSDPDLSKRMLDFASGLTYGLGGGLKKVAERVFMLTPVNFDVSAEERRRLKDSGLFTLDQ